MITQIMTFLAMYSLFRGMKGFLNYKKGKKTHDIMKGAEPIFCKAGKKGVLMVHGFTSSPSDLKDLSKVVKKRCGVGGSVKAGEIIIQTKDRQKLLQILIDLGYFAKLSGG